MKIIEFFKIIEIIEIIWNRTRMIPAMGLKINPKLIQLINWLTEWSFVEIYSKQLHSKTGRARKLKFWEKAYLPLSVMDHMSNVMSHVSHVMCHNICPYIFSFSFFNKRVILVSGGFVINGTTPPNYYCHTILTTLK